MRPRRAAFALLSGLLAAAPAAAAGDGAAAVPGLAEGNRLFRAGRLEPAMAAYATGWRASGEPVLAYNLGAAAQQLGRLPEALLWYRRAAEGLAGDPWLRDNLALVRHALGPPPVPAPGPWGLLAAQRQRLCWAGVALAWTGLALALARSRAARWALGGAALLACGAFATGIFLGLLGPEPAVLLEGCGEELAAGSEVWVRPARNGFRVLGAPPDLRCPPAAVGRIAPRRL